MQKEQLIKACPKLFNNDNNHLNNNCISKVHYKWTRLSLVLKPRPHYAEWCQATGLIDTVEQVWTCRPALLSHAGPNRTQPESSRYGSKEVDPTSVNVDVLKPVIQLFRLLFINYFI